MNICKMGDMVIFKQEKTRVIDLQEIDGQKFAILELQDKQCISVSCLDIKRNGNLLFVTPNGCNVADAIGVLKKY